MGEQSLEKLAALEVLLKEIRDRLSRLEERNQPEPTCFAFPAAAKRLGVGLTKLKEMVRRGEIRTATVGRRKMITKQEIDRVSKVDEPLPSRPTTRRKAQEANQDPAALDAILRRRR